MEAQVAEIVASLDARDPQFRAQVQALRAFRKQISESGHVVEGAGYTVSLMERIAPPHERTVAVFDALASRPPLI